MKKSIFNLGNLSIAAKGVKSSNDVRPEILTGRAFNKFTMNGLASSLMQLQDGDSMVIISDDSSDDLNNKYYLAKTSDDLGVKLASVGHAKGFGKALSFNYAGKWSEMIQNATDRTDAKAVGKASMINADYLVKEATQLNKKGEQSYDELSTYRIGYQVEELMEDGEPVKDVTIDGVTFEKLFVLTNPIKYNKDGKTHFNEELNEQAVSDEEENSYE